MKTIGKMDITDRVLQDQNFSDFVNIGSSPADPKATY